jgi:hypothetical protein
MQGETDEEALALLKGAGIPTGSGQAPGGGARTKSGPGEPGPYKGMGERTRKLAGPFGRTQGKSFDQSQDEQELL